MIELFETATPDHFFPEGYLWANPDVAADAGEDPGRPLAHLMRFGLAEGRRQVRQGALAEIAGARAKKLSRLGGALEEHVEQLMGTVLSMGKAPDDRLPVPYERVSAHGYDPDTAALVDGNPDGLYLDLGAGFREQYRENVVYAEIAALPTTDVLCFGDAMPFDSEIFDGATCLSVLEHVEDPFATVAELYRVVRPAGTIVVDWPFLQPVHGYPQHFFNATPLGARSAFERLGADVRTSVPPWLHPTFTLHWVLSEWITGLSDQQRAAFGRLTVDEILSKPPAHFLQQPWAAELPGPTVETICAGTRLVVTKR